MRELLETIANELAEIAREFVLFRWAARRLTICAETLRELARRVKD